MGKAGRAIIGRSPKKLSKKLNNSGNNFKTEVYNRRHFTPTLNDHPFHFDYKPSKGPKEKSIDDPRHYRMKKFNKIPNMNAEKFKYMYRWESIFRPKFNVNFRRAPPPEDTSNVIRMNPEEEEEEAAQERAGAEGHHGYGREME